MTLDFKVGDEIRTKSSKEAKDAVFKVFRVLALEHFGGQQCYVCKATVKREEETLGEDLGVIPVNLQGEFSLYSVETEVSDDSTQVPK